MKLTKEDALNLHRQMWSDMQKALGDNPKDYERTQFKEKWCAKHFPDENIFNSCFLCEYVNNNNVSCCLIDWPYRTCATHSYYYNAPISEILALPERKEDKA